MSMAKILVVDDEESLRLPLQTAFQSEGYETALAANGTEALEILKAGDCEVMLTDLMMPKMNGIDLMDKARALIPDLVVILMTGYGTVETAIQALKGGAYDYILKPFKLGEILHVVGRGLEEKRLRRENIELNEINRKLTEIDQIKSNLLRAISHEFRTPLTVIYGWIDLILSDPYSSQNSMQTEGLKAIKESSLRLGRMISNLLEYVRLGRESMRLIQEKVDLLPLIREALRLLEDEIRERGLGVVETLPPSLPLLLADPEKMKILVFNLLENAVKFNEAGGEVLVGAEGTPSQEVLRLRITNTRGEFPHDRLPELVKPFTQADMSITRSVSGLGLGLAVAKGIAEAHQAEFTIRSERGKGTTVEILFPLVPPSA